VRLSSIWLDRRLSPIENGLLKGYEGGNLVDFTSISKANISRESSSYPTQTSFNFLYSTYLPTKKGDFLLLLLLYNSELLLFSHRYFILKNHLFKVVKMHIGDCADFWVEFLGSNLHGYFPCPKLLQTPFLYEVAGKKYLWDVALFTNSILLHLFWFLCFTSVYTATPYLI